MSRLKKKCGSHKLSKDVATNYKCGNSEEYVLISFAFVTENKKYNFDYFRDSMHREEIAARRSLDRLLNELSINTWLALGQRSKYQIGGFEKFRVILVTTQFLTSFRFLLIQTYTLFGLGMEIVTG